MNEILPSNKCPHGISLTAVPPCHFCDHDQYVEWVTPQLERLGREMAENELLRTEKEILQRANRFLSEQVASASETRPPLNFFSITTSVDEVYGPRVLMRFAKVGAAQAVHHWLAVLQAESATNGEAQSLRAFVSESQRTVAEMGNRYIPPAPDDRTEIDAQDDRDLDAWHGDR